MCTKKTKTELIEEINNLKKDLDKLERYRKYEDTANEIKAIHDSFVNAGFTEDQAFKIMITAMNMPRAE